MKLNLSLIEKDPSLRNRLKEAAKDSVQDFFPGRETPEEALEYVVAAFCLCETDAQFNTRLQLLFEKDCTAIVKSLGSFVENNPEFTQAPETETKKEAPKPRRQKIVWDASLEKSTTETSTEEKKKKSTTRKKSTAKEPPAKPVHEPTERKKRDSHGAKLRTGPQVEDGSLDRWQPDVDMDEEEGQILPSVEDVSHECAHTRQPKMLKSRLFESALGSIKQQVKREATKMDALLDHKPDLERAKSLQHPNGHTSRETPIKLEPIHVVPKPRLQAVLVKEIAPQELKIEPPTYGMDRPVFKIEPSAFRIEPPAYALPGRQEGSSILDRIRKPDGSEFEEWELKREPRGKKRQAAEPRDVQPEKPIDMSEVESLKLKIARLEKEVQNVQAPPIMNFYPAARLPAQDFDVLSVCVKNVHFLANEEVVAAHFHSCSPIVKIDFAKDLYGRPKGFCFIQFAREACVARALELDQSLLLGRNISVVRKLTRPPAPTPAKPVREYVRPPWQVPTPGMPMGPNLKEEWNNGAVEDVHDIQDFAIDTGSQDMP